ncbi:hypothetical protein V8C86DRAFT_2940715 [Haematococcus lacustris]
MFSRPHTLKTVFGGWRMSLRAQPEYTIMRNATITRGPRTQLRCLAPGLASPCLRARRRNSCLYARSRIIALQPATLPLKSPYEKPSTPRREKADEKSSGTGPGSQPPGQGGPERFGKLQLLAGHAAFTGLTGTLAVWGAHALNLNLPAMFDWQQPGHLVLLLLLILPLQAANVLLLAPDWSSWQLPTLSEEEATAARRVKPEPGPGPPQLLTHTHSSDTTLGSQREASGGSGSGQDAGQTPTGQAPGSRQQAQPGGAEAGSSSAGGGGEVLRGRAPPLDPGLRLVPASSWGAPPPPSGAPGGRPLLPQHLAAAAPRLLSSLRDAAHLAQGFYVSANPTAGLPVAAELGVSALDSLASEMLLRGVLISSLANWLRDRALEAGALEVLPAPPALATLLNGHWLDAAQLPHTTASWLAALPSSLSALMAGWQGLAASGSAGVGAGAGELAAAVGAAGGALDHFVSLDDACRWAAAGLVVALVAGLGVRRILRTARKSALMAEIRTRILAARELQTLQQDARARLAPPALPPLPLPAAAEVEEGQGHQGGAPATADDAPGSTASGSSSSGVDGVGVVNQAGGREAAGAAGHQAPAASQLDKIGAGEGSAQGQASQARPQEPSPTSSSPTDRLQPGSSENAPAPSQEPAPSPSPRPPGPRDGAVSENATLLADLLARSTITRLPGSSSPGQPAPRMALRGRPGGRPGFSPPASGPLGESGGIDALTLSAAVQTARDLLQTTTLTAVFVGTGGNLAASWAASWINMAVFSLLQRLGSERLRQRSIAMAQELEEFNSQLHVIAKKQAQRKANLSTAPLPSAPPALLPSNTKASTPHEDAPLQEPLVSQSVDNGEGCVPPGQPAPQLPAQSLAVEDMGEDPVARTQSGVPKEVGKLKRALSVLDVLLPETSPPQPGSDATK